MAKRKVTSDPVITISPVPPVQGQPMVVHYTGAPGTKLTVDWDPGNEEEIKIGGDGTATVTVPANATSVWVSGGGAASAQSVVVPRP